MTPVLIDSNVLLDIITEDPQWMDWSATTLARIADQARVFINPIIYAEVSMGFNHVEALEKALSLEWIEREPLPYEAAFLAGKVFLSYRRRDGQKVLPLPDFFIGAHAFVLGYRLLTRDPRPYRTYFPKVDWIAP